MNDRVMQRQLGAWRDVVHTNHDASGSLQEQLSVLAQQVHALSAARQPSPSEVLATAFGAVGDGVHDDTAGLQAAIDRARNSSLSLRFPVGKYRITKHLDWGQWNA